MPAPAHARKGTKPNLNFVGCASWSPPPTWRLQFFSNLTVFSGLDSASRSLPQAMGPRAPSLAVSEKRLCRHICLSCWHKSSQNIPELLGEMFATIAAKTSTHFSPSSNARLFNFRSELSGSGSGGGLGLARVYEFSAATTCKRICK